MLPALPYLRPVVARGPPRPVVPAAAAAAVVVPAAARGPPRGPRGPPRPVAAAGPPKCQPILAALPVNFKNMTSNRIKPNLIARSIDVLDNLPPGTTWKDQTLKYKGGEFEHVYAFDCEMVYACKRPFFDNRPGLSITKPNLLNYHAATNDKGYREKKTPDEAKSAVEFFGRDVFNNGVDKDDWHDKNAAQAFLDTKELVKVLAQIVITDWCGHVIYEKYVQPDTEVVWTAKQFSGIPQGFFTVGHDAYHRLAQIGVGPAGPDVLATEFATLEEVCMCLDSLFIHANSKIVGHGIIKGDFPCMDYPIDAPNKYNKVRDTGEYYKNNTDDNQEGCALLCKNLLNQEIQMADGGHDPSEDARGALALYKLDYDNWEKKLNSRCAIVNMAMIMLPEPFQLPQPFQQPAGLNLPRPILDRSVAELSPGDLAQFTRANPALMSAALKLVQKNTPLYFQLSKKNMELFDE